jgi:hypothetical protein
MNYIIYKVLIARCIRILARYCAYACATFHIHVWTCWRGGVFVLFHVAVVQFLYTNLMCKIWSWFLVSSHCSPRFTWNHGCLWNVDLNVAPCWYLCGCTNDKILHNNIRIYKNWTTAAWNSTKLPLLLIATIMNFIRILNCRDMLTI